MKIRLLLLVFVTGTLVALSSNLSSPSKVASATTIGTSDNGLLVKQWTLDMSYYSWGWFGSSPAIGNLGPDVNTKGGEPDSHLEIVTGSDEYCRYYPELGANACGIWRVLDSGGNIEWAKSTETDEARSSPAIVDIDGDGDFEIAGGTTSGWNVEILDHRGSFVWTFPWPPTWGGLFMWPSSPAIADLNPAVSGLEVVIGSNYLGSVWAFDGDNSDGINDGITADLSWYPYSAGTEGIHWDVLWVFQTKGSVVATPAIADVDKDGELEVVIGSTDGNLYVLNGINGTPEAIFPTGGAIYSSAAVANLDGDPYLEMVVGSTDGKLYAFSWDGSTAKTKWTFATGGPIYSSPAIGDVDGDGALEVVVGSNDGKVYALTASGAQKWSYTTGGAVYSSPALANRDSVTPYQRSWPMFRHDERRTGYHGPPFGKPLAVYIGSDDHYLYVLDGRNGSLIDRFLTYGPIHTSPSVADVDGDKKLEIFFYDWGTGSSYGGHTFWAVKDRGSMPTPKFMTLPFNDPTINIVQGWIYTWGTPHRGIDYIKGQVTEEPKNWQEFKVLAVADGEAKYVPMDEPGGNQTWGNYVVTKHVIQGKTYYTVNAHLSKSPLPKNEWVSIKRGVEIGTAGDSGNMPRCKKPCIHLHFEVATDWPPMGAKIDPYDIYSTRDYYPGGSKFTECGSNYLWATCPPSSP